MTIKACLSGYSIERREILTFTKVDSFISGQNLSFLTK